MTNEQKNIYLQLKQTAVRTAEVLGKPSFYTEHADELKISGDLLKTDALMKKCLSYLDDAAMYAGHGIPHAKAVASDAGAILQIEGKLRNTPAESMADLILYVQIAGIFHDIKRKEKNHTITGSAEAARILENFIIQDRYKRYIVAAIRNHEAFKEVLDSENAIAELISDSLYDADKFRWGPDNFTTTLWLLVDLFDMPVENLHRNFRKNIDFIETIKGTFRTQTGRKYGPEIIDRGIKIGEAIFKEMSEILHRS
jgi:predicted Ser/Thr protein kinase